MISIRDSDADARVRLWEASQILLALNHMTVALTPFKGLLEIASTLRAEGVELRNDLSAPLFDGLGPEQAGAIVRAKGLRILALAEVKMFNDWSARKAEEADALMQIAVACGAEAISLIPLNNGVGTEPVQRRADLRVALQGLQSLLEEYGLVGLIEPLGFQTSTLRFKAEIVEEIEALNAADHFKLIHDTFHHVLAGEEEYFAAHTGIVHISGVVNSNLTPSQMRDEDRVLVDERDRLQNIEQIRRLSADGYDGPISFEAFSKDVHNFADPGVELSRSIHFIESGLAAEAA
jgi:2-keto-myo-inositol isomerase